MISGEALLAWLMTLSGVVSAVACLRARGVVPWQGRQCALIMSGAMVLSASVDLESHSVLALCVVLVLSSLLGTAGVRGKASAPLCCHRAIASITMAVLLALQLSTDSTGTAAHSHSIGPGIWGLGAAGIVVVAVWAAAAERSGHGVERDRHRRFLSAETWAMTCGLVVMGVGHAAM